MSRKNKRLKMIIFDNFKLTFCNTWRLWTNYSCWICPTIQKFAMTVNLLSVKGTIERVLDKNMQDLVRGIRNHKHDESKYINERLEEIKSELRQSSFECKSNAIAKLVYLQMLGYDLSWAMFNTVEVMSSPKFTCKRIGYLAAAQSFRPDSDVLMLTTNLIRKDLCSGIMYDTGLALSSLSCFMTPELAVDLHNNILMLTTSPKPYIRKKAVLLLYRVFLKHPDALPVCFPRLKEMLEDTDPGVQSAAVNVICELSRRNPKSYLSLAPIFFKLMTTSTNNWVLIKIIKLFASLTAIEPRLGKKLIDPLTNLINSTTAMSLLYECVNTVIAVLISISADVPGHHSSIQLCVQKLRVLIEDSDQNLKYLGLLAMTKILHYHPKSVQSHKDLIICCLDDKDESIRLRALNLLHGMVSQQNLMEIVQFLLKHVGQSSTSSQYRNEMVTKIIHICSQEDYYYVTSFEWYISVLVELTRMDGVANGALLASQLMDVAMRVPSVRAFCVTQMAVLLDICSNSVNARAATSTEPTILPFNSSAISDVVSAASWICGEYSVHLENPEETLFCVLSSAYGLPEISFKAQSVLLLNAFKIYTALAVKDLKGEYETHVELEPILSRLLQLTTHMMEDVARFVHSPDLEVQERGVTFHHLLNLMRKRLASFQTSVVNHHPDSREEKLIPVDQSECSPCGKSGSVQWQTLLDSMRTIGCELSMIFCGEIKPVAPKAQLTVPIPEGLDLDAWINPPPDYRSSKPSPHFGAIGIVSVDGGGGAMDVNKTPATHLDRTNIFPCLSTSPQKIQLNDDELQKRKEERLKEQQTNPHYLKVTKGANMDPVPEDIYQPLDESQCSTKSTDHPLFDGDHPSSNSRTSGVVRQLTRPDQFIDGKTFSPSWKEKSARAPHAKQRRKKMTKESSDTKRLENGAGIPTPDARQPPLVCSDFDVPEGAIIKEESPHDILDPNDPHSRLAMPLDDSILSGNRPSNKSSKSSEKTKRSPKSAVNSIDETRQSNGLCTPPSNSFCQAHLSKTEFVDLLSSSRLKCSSTAKVRCHISKPVIENPSSADKVFQSITEALVQKVPCNLIESIGFHAASLYTLYSISKHSVCILLKLSKTSGTVTLAVKSDSDVGVEICLQRIKSIIQSLPAVS